MDRALVDVLDFLRKGRTNKEVTTLTGISLHTMRRIMRGERVTARTRNKIMMACQKGFVITEVVKQDQYYKSK